MKAQVKESLSKIEAFTDSARSTFDEIQIRLSKCENKLKTLFEKQGEIVKLVKSGGGEQQLTHSPSTDQVTNKEEVEKLVQLINSVKKDSEKHIAQIRAELTQKPSA